MGKTRRDRAKGVARKLVGCVAVAGLAATMSAGAAFATDQTSTTYALPTAGEVVSFQHTATANGADYTYEYVTIGSNATGRVAPMAQTYYEVLGLNYINAYRGPDSIFIGDSAVAHEKENGLDRTYTTGRFGALQTRNSTLAIMGTSNNVAPDEYIWNYCCWANGAEVADDSMALDHGNATTGAVSVTIGGTEYADFPRDVYSECNIISAEGSSAAYGGTSYLAWIELENQRANRPKTGTYDPYFVKYSVASGGGATMVAGLHTLANTIDSIVAQSKDANGNYTLQSRYGGNTDSGTGAAIDKYEDLVQATQYYVLSKLEGGQTKKAVTATLVGYDPITGNYACRKYNVKDGDKDANFYGGRVAGYLGSISTSITELGLTEAQSPYSENEQAYVSWYTPEQIVANCDAAFICDAPSTNKISTYLATSSDNEQHVVYSPETIGYAEEDNTGALVAAREAMLAANPDADVANFCFSYPANMFGNFYAQGVENGMLALITSSFTYPEIFGSNGLTDLLAYWAKYVWHIKDSSLQTIVEGTCSYMSMQGLSIGTISSNFEENAETFFAEGNRFYIQHKDEMDAISGGNLKTFDIDALVARTSEAPAVNSGAPLAKATAQAELKATALTGTTSYSKTVGDASFKLDIAASTGAALSYASSDEKVVTVDAAGTVTVVGEGSARIAVTAARSGANAANVAYVDVTVKAKPAAKKANPVTVATKTVKLKASKVKKAKQTVAANKAFTVKKAQGKVTYKKAAGNKKITVASSGKITVKKGLKKGSYQITVKITAAGNGSYKAKTVSKKVTVKIS